ncbi:MAG: hypothetical protein LBT49_07065 [Prevotellaceae bacterium]|jgi:hypothetical protein|nr:hypothetical protein [Prevotellaceae bacterium]
MKKTIFTATMLMLGAACVFAQWNPSKDKIRTKWADEVNLANVLSGCTRQHDKELIKMDKDG